MDKPDQNIEGINRFTAKYSDYTDTQILEILRKHKDFQEMAVTAAVKIAIERQLIHSEQDLMSPEFQYSKKYRFTLFPEISNAYYQGRLIASIFRVLYILSLLPMIYGIMKYAEGFIDQAIFGIVIGVTWLILSILLNRTIRQFLISIMLAILFGVSASVGFKIFTSESFKLIDLVLLVIIFLLFAYLLIYLKKLIRANPDGI
jgi:hypothetical protein